MNKPWFDLNPNNFRDRWWLYSSITNTKSASTIKNETDVICHLILQDNNDMGKVFYRVSTWYKNDPNRYLTIRYDTKDLKINKTINGLADFKEGDIVIINDIKFAVYKCRFGGPDQVEYCKILERIEDLELLYLF